MSHRTTSAPRSELAPQFLELRAALAAESPGALELLAALAMHAFARGDLLVATASAGAAILVEHLQWAVHRHAPRMLGILADAGPDAASAGSDGLFAWAGAAVAHDYGVLPSWPAADVGMLMERAQHASNDAALALGCALGEVCERNGADAEFAALYAQIAAFEVQAGASPLWRGYWSIACAWHLHSFGKLAEAAQRLELALTLAAEHGLAGLGSTAALQCARLIECRRDPARALALADRAVARGDPSSTPLWWADRDDVRCRIALNRFDFHAAVGHARRAVGHVRAAAVWPGYQVGYRANEGYALLGTGAIDEALACFNEIKETPMPRYQAARLQCLVDLAALSAADRRGQWTETNQAELAQTLRRLRELEWASVLPMLPEYIARLFSRALGGGLEVDWVRAAIRTRALSAPPGAPEAWPWPVLVRTLGRFEVVTESGPLRQPLRAAQKASSKPLDLLRFLAAHGHDAVPIDVAAATLWAGDGREGRQKAFDITVARLRRLLGHDAAVAVNDRRVRLDHRSVWIDAQAVSDRLAEGEAAGAGSAEAGIALEAALALYRGPFIADTSEGWAVVARERLQTRLAAALLHAMRRPGVDGSQSREWMLRAISADPRVAELIGPATLPESVPAQDRPAR